MAKLTLFFQNRVVATFTVDAVPLRIGRNPDSEIRIDSLAVAELHARVVRRGDHHELRPQAPDNRVTINHQPLDGPALLHHGDVIQIGRHKLTFTEPEPEIAFLPPGEAPEQPRPATPAVPPPVAAAFSALPIGGVQVVSGRHIGKTIALDRPLMRLGLTGNECAIIARRHDGYYLTHLEGRAPLLLNGRSLGDRTERLRAGDNLRLGEIEMQFFSELQPARAAGA